MNPALELAKLLGRKTSAQTVSVIESTPTLIRATTRVGPVEFKNDGSLYVQGDVLIVRDSVVIGRAVREENVPVYYI